MLSSRINNTDNSDDDEVESTMSDNYKPWTRVVSRTTTSTTIPSLLQPIASTVARSRRWPPTVSSVPAPKIQSPITLDTSPMRYHLSRRRSITPEIIIKRRHRHHRSSGRRHVITIPLDHHSTRDLWGSSERVLEIERVRRRRHRHRKRPSSCYNIDYNILPPPPMEPQSNIIITDPILYSYIPLAQSSLIVPSNNSAASLALLPNSTSEIIENLPQQIIHLAPVHLTGSQADVNTELHTVIYPAEVFAPGDESISIIQSNPTINSGGTTNIQPLISVPSQPQLFSTQINAEPPPASGPFTQQVQDFLQRLTLSHVQSTSPPLNHTTIQSSLPIISQNNATMNSFYNLQTVAPIDTTTPRSYLPTNTQPINTSSNISYIPTTFTPSRPANTMPYRPANITPYNPINLTSYQPANNMPYQPANNMPYPPANITPYHSTNPTTSSPTSPRSDHLSRFAPSNFSDNSAYRPANITLSSPTNTTSHQTANFTLSKPARTRSNYYTQVVPSNFSEHGPYRPANITPYSAASHNSVGNSTVPPSNPSESTPYIASSSLHSSGTLTSYSSNIGNSAINIPYTSQSLSQTPYQSDNSMPKSILRNTPSNHLLNTTDTRSKLPSISFSNNIVRKTAVFT